MQQVKKHVTHAVAACALVSADKVEIRHLGLGLREMFMGVQIYGSENAVSVWLDRDFREFVLGIAVGRRCVAVLACCLLSLLGIPFYLSMDSLPHVRCLLAFLCPMIVYYMWSTLDIAEFTSV
ncbi:hypothetical protein M0R45_017265 [Rubus argutus]|uniref:Uncharacterized protein n=1 Tax=Rubus argutus TaxID=59490 RepID=A0AAW1XV88_RUBAR